MDSVITLRVRELIFSRLWLLPVTVEDDYSTPVGEIWLCIATMLGRRDRDDKLDEDSCWMRVEVREHFMASLYMYALLPTGEEWAFRLVASR